MENRHLKLIWLAIAFLIVGMAGFYAGQDSVTTITEQALFSSNEPFVPPPQIKNQACVAQNSLPDPDCTPGAVFADVTKEQICVSGYSKTVRNVSESLKKKVYKEYGVAYPPPFGTYELDHYVALSLGGSNDIANLWPFAADPRPGFIEKDLTVNYLHRKLCAGEISLAAAQRAITTPWIQVYNSISPSEKAELQRLFPTWANIRK